MAASFLPLQWPVQHEESGVLSDLPLLGSNAVLWRRFRRLAAARDFSAVLLWGDDVITLKVYIIVSAIAISEFAWGPVVFIPDDLCRVVFWNPRWGQEDMDSILMLGRVFKLSDALAASWTRQWAAMTIGTLVRDIQHHGNFEPMS